MAMQLPKVVTIESLKVDIRFGPEEKTEQLYNLAFSFKYGSPFEWDFNVKFAAFQELNKVLSATSPHLLSTEFPKAHRSRAAFRVKLSPDLLEQRRNILTLWLRELIANYDLLPQSVQDAVIDFFKVPIEYNLRFTTKDSLSDSSRSPMGSPEPIRTRRPSGTSASTTAVAVAAATSTTAVPTTTAAAVPRRPSFKGSKNMTKQRSNSIDSPSHEDCEDIPLQSMERPFNPKVYTVYSLFLNVLELAEILMDSVSPLHTSTTVNKVLCLSRRDSVILESVKPIFRLFVEDLMSVYFFGCYCALLSCVIFSANPEDYFDGSFASRLLNVSIISLCIMLFRDQYVLHLKNLEIQQSNTQGFDAIQSQVDHFIPTSNDIRLREYLAPFFGIALSKADRGHRTHSRYGRALLLRSFNEAKAFRRHPPVVNKIAAVADRDSFTVDQRLSFVDELAVGDVSTHSGGIASSNTSGSMLFEDVLSSTELNDATTPTIVDPVKEQQELEKQKKLAARKAFDEFVFPGITPTAAAMFIDRKYTHNFQVRGANYLTDKKKIHPGSAMCKLMLLELYEVDTSKDGDRHDHIAARGLVKSRRETIAALPGNPFQILINFQIPGDPPVSVVAYFAVPPDLADRYDPAELATFQALFSQFINLPVNETERLAAWGVVDSSSVGTGGEAGEQSGNNTEDSEGEEGSSSSSRQHPKSPPRSGAASGAASGAGNSWFKMPSDIRWPDPHEPGALPQSDFRNQRFKLIPSVVEGPWVVKTAVRSQPALLGRKVVQRYFRGEGYMEIDIHVGSSGIAMNVVGVCRGYTKNAAADLGIVIQGEDPKELPEKMLGCVCFNHIDMEVRHKLD